MAYTIKRGDAYKIPVDLFMDGEQVTEDDLVIFHCVEFMIGEDIRKVFPDSADFADGGFLVPVTEEETFNLETGNLEMDVRAHFATGDVVGIRKALTIKVVDSISEVILNE